MTAIRVLTGDFAAAPQISPADAAAAKASGYAGIICNRPDGEDPGQPAAATIAAAAAAAGLSFVHIPVSGMPGPDQVSAMRAALAEAGGPVLAYCRSGTRSTHLWAMARASAGDDPATLSAAAARGGYDLSGLLPLLARLREGA